MVYHIRITLRSDRSRPEVGLDLSEDDLKTRVLEPYHRGGAITMGGRAIRVDDIERIRINYTEETAEQLRPVVMAQLERDRLEGFLSLASDEWSIAGQGREVTNELIKEPPGSLLPRPQVEPGASSIGPLEMSGLHPEVIAAADSLFSDGHHAQAVFEALKALEDRVRDQSRFDSSGRDLMTKAFSGDPPPIILSTEPGRSGLDEQEGLRFVFMGIIQGIRNPKAHRLVRQDDPQRALEYLATVSVLFRRLDDARDRSSSGPGHAGKRGVPGGSLP